MSCCFSDNSESSQTPKLQTTSDGCIVSMPIVRLTSLPASLARLYFEPTNSASVLLAFSWRRRFAHHIRKLAVHFLKYLLYVFPYCWQTSSKCIIRFRTFVKRVSVFILLCRNNILQRSKRCICYGKSVRLSVRPSLRYCVKTRKRKRCGLHHRVAQRL